MMKIIAVIILILGVALNSKPVDSKTAENIANSFISRYALKMKYADQFLTISSDQQVLGYAFNCQPAGYIVVSADDRLAPVIAYSEDGEISADAPMTLLIQSDLQLRLKNQQSQNSRHKNLQNREWTELSKTSPVKAPVEQWPAAGTTASGGWTDTKWKQTSPYNKFCPLDPNTNQRSIAGCPAIAMAQILYYHKLINQTRFNENDCYFNLKGRFWIDDTWEQHQYLSFRQMNVYLDSIENKFMLNSALTSDEISALVFACGVACKSVYGSESSGTFSVNQAFAAFQKFGFADAVLLDSACTDDEIRQKMIDNIKTGLPVHLATVDANWSSGHNVVCDGYRDNGFFRLNMGWGGTANGWYSLPQGFPYSLTVFEGIVADIRRNLSIPENERKYNLSVSNYPNPFNNTTRISYQMTECGSVNLTVFNAKGEVVKNIYEGFQTAGKNSLTIDAADLNSGVYFYTLQINGTRRAADKMLLLR